MLSIGEFARYVGVSVRMLRHYDSLGLLVPALVDPTTGYRFYNAAQISRANRLVALKELGFGLAQIGPILDAQVSADELRGMLTMRRAQVAEQIETDQARLREIERRLRSIEGEAMSELEFTLKPLPQVRLAQLTGHVTEQRQIGEVISPLFDRLAGTLGPAGLIGAEPAVAWYEGDGDGLTIAAAFPTALSEPTAAMAEQGIEIDTLPAFERAATVLHHGAMDTIGDTWQALARYVEEQGWTPSGRCREVYLQMTLDGDQSGDVTELQQPLA